MTGFLPGTRTQEQRREICDLLGNVTAFGERIGLDEVMNPALGGIFRHYIRADMCMLAGDSEGDNLGLAQTRHELLLLRRQLIEVASAQCRKNLLEMLNEYGNEAVRCHLNMPECNRAMSEADAFVNETRKDDPVKLYKAMSNAGEIEDKVAGILRMVQDAHPLIKAGAEPKADAAKPGAEKETKDSVWKHPLLVVAAGALIAGLIKWIIG